MKQFLPLLLLSLFFVSCKPTSNIITSKTEAQKRGIYKAPNGNTRVATRNTTPTRATVNAPEKRSETRKIDRRRQIEERADDDLVLNVDNSSYMVRQLINAAEENLGAGYHSGGTSPNTGYDCSGLMFSTFKKFDITLPRSSNDMAKVGRRLDNDEIRKGDLIFFRTNGRSVINHVGMVTEVSDDEIKFIHSSTQKGVIISSTKEAYYGRTFAQANRILE